MDQKSGKPSQKRRAILQGSLAAPLVLTVPSVGAQALTSLSRKLQNVKNYQPSESEYFKDAPDEWLRQSVQVVQLKFTPKGGQTDTLFATRNEWFYLDTNKNEFFKVGSVPSSKGWMGFGIPLPEEWAINGVPSTRYLLVWLDPETGYKYLKQPAPVGDQVAATCSVLSFTCSNGVG